MSLDIPPSEQNILRGFRGEMTAELSALIISLQSNPREKLYYKGRRLQDTGTENGVGIILCPEGYDSFNAKCTPIYDETEGLIILNCDEKYKSGDGKIDFTRSKVAGLQTDNSWLLPPEGKRLISIGQINNNGERICRLIDLECDGMAEWEELNANNNSVYTKNSGWLSLEVDGQVKNMFKNIEEILGGYSFETQNGIGTIRRDISYALETIQTPFAIPKI